jgi:sulfoxide reductase heme-binding subunit YedZ
LGRALSARLRPGKVRERIAYGAVWLALALPLPWHLWIGLTGNMRQRDGLVKEEGLWAIRILMLCLAITPAARLLRWPALLRYKRTIGLFGFTYAAVHGIFYMFYGRVWEFPLRVWQRRLYIPLGILALALMVPLAVTSTDGMLRRMGPQAWRRLHQTFYAVMLMGAVHGLWQSNIDYLQPAIYLGMVVLLLIVRIRPVMLWLMALSPAKRRPRAPGAVQGSAP